MFPVNRAARRTTSFDPLVADFVFNHSSCNRLRIGAHYCAPVPPAGYVYGFDLIHPRPLQGGRRAPVLERQIVTNVTMLSTRKPTDARQASHILPHTSRH